MRYNDVKDDFLLDKKVKDKMLADGLDYKTALLSLSTEQRNFEHEVKEFHEATSIEAKQAFERRVDEIVDAICKKHKHDNDFSSAEIQQVWSKVSELCKTDGTEVVKEYVSGMEYKEILEITAEDMKSYTAKPRISSSTLDNKWTVKRYS